MTDPRDNGTDPRPDEQTAEETVAPDKVTDEQENENAAADDPVDVESEEPVELSDEEILRGERDAFEQKWLRVVAELDNVRKRSRREVLETRRFSQAEILRSLLDVQDNFERALQSAADSSDTGEVEALREGVELIFQKFRTILKDKGVQPMEALGVEFDPTFHEAVGQIPREGSEPGQVIEVIQQGFHFGDMVLRPAKVIISS